MSQARLRTAGDARGRSPGCLGCTGCIAEDAAEGGLRAVPIAGDVVAATASPPTTADATAEPSDGLDVAEPEPVDMFEAWPGGVACVSALVSPVCDGEVCVVCADVSLFTVAASPLKLPAPSTSNRISSPPTAITSPTLPPSATTLPTTGDGISTVALSVITSAKGWSSATVSPTFTCQATNSTSAIPSPMSGILMI